VRGYDGAHERPDHPQTQRSTVLLTEAPGIETIAARPITEFDGPHDVWPRGDRLEAIRAAAAAYAERFAAAGEVHTVATHTIAAVAYPTKFAFHNAAIAPTVPYVWIVNRMLIVQFEDFEGRRRTLLWEPTIPEGSAEAPFYAQLQERITRLPAGNYLADHVFAKYYTTVPAALQEAGLEPADVDYLSFDHLHVQDPRMLLGTTEPIGDEPEPRPPLFPNARLIVQRRELATFESTHPMQWAWYVDGGMDDIPAERVVAIDGDIELGIGVSLIATPGHTDGNHSLALNTPDGVWVSSENGVAIDNWQPQLSKIPGVKNYCDFFNREIVPNANTLEDSLDQYDSMVKEKTLAAPCRHDPRWLQILPSSELAHWKRQWPVVPTRTQGGIDYRSPQRPGE
jgi:hypothetical protein